MWFCANPDPPTPRPESRGGTREGGREGEGKREPSSNHCRDLGRGGPKPRRGAPGRRNSPGRRCPPAPPGLCPLPREATAGQRGRSTARRGGRSPFCPLARLSLFPGNRSLCWSCAPGGRGRFFRLFAFHLLPPPSLLLPRTGGPEGGRRWRSRALPPASCPRRAPGTKRSSQWGRNGGEREGCQGSFPSPR